MREGDEALRGEPLALVLCRHPVVRPAGAMLPLDVAETHVPDGFVVDGDGEVAAVRTIRDEEALDEVDARLSRLEVGTTQLVEEVRRRRRGAAEGSSIVITPRPQINLHGSMLARRTPSACQ